MKYNKTIKISLALEGNKFENIEIGVSEAPSFEECDRQIIKNIKNCGLTVDDAIRTALRWEEKK